MNVVMPFYAVSSGLLSSNITIDDSSFFGEKILICTTAGYQWVNIADFSNGSTWQSAAMSKVELATAEDLKPESQGQHGNGGFKCPLCYLVEDDIVDIAHISTVVEHYELWRSTQYLLLNSPQYRQRLLLSGKRSRAPPLIIS